MPRKIDPRELTAFGRTDVENEIQELIEHVLKEPKIPTMDKKLIVEASTEGHFPGKLWEGVGVKNMPPWSVDDQAASIIECVKAGAGAIHAHPRDPKGKFNYETHAGIDMSPELHKLVMDKAYKEVDFMPLGHAWHPKNWGDMAEGDFVAPTKELLEAGNGNKYIQGNAMPTWIYPWCRRGLLSCWFTANSLREGVAYLEANNVKPMVAMHIEHLTWFKNNVIDAGVFKKPPHLNIQEGKHGQSRSLTDPESYINIITSIQMVRKLVPDATIGLHAGGRNWLPMTVMAIMMGVDLVRIGIEDMFFTYPHKDDFIKKPAESVARVVQIVRALGRDVATAAEARKILKIKVTWK